MSPRTTGSVGVAFSSAIMESANSLGRPNRTFTPGSACRAFARMFRTASGDGGPMLSLRTKNASQVLCRQPFGGVMLSHPYSGDAPNKTREPSGPSHQQRVGIFFISESGLLPLLAPRWRNFTPACARIVGNAHACSGMSVCLASAGNGNPKRRASREPYDKSRTSSSISAASASNVYGIACHMSRCCFTASSSFTRRSGVCCSSSTTSIAQAGSIQRNRSGSGAFLVCSNIASSLSMSSARYLWMTSGTVCV